MRSCLTFGKSTGPDYHGAPDEKGREECRWGKPPAQDASHPECSATKGGQDASADGVWKGWNDSHWAALTPLVIFDQRAKSDLDCGQK